MRGRCIVCIRGEWVGILLLGHFLGHSWPIFLGTYQSIIGRDDDVEGEIYMSGGNVQDIFP